MDRQKEARPYAIISAVLFFVCAVIAAAYSVKYVIEVGFFDFFSYDFNISILFSALHSLLIFLLGLFILNEKSKKLIAILLVDAPVCILCIYFHIDYIVLLMVFILLPFTLLIAMLLTTKDSAIKTLFIVFAIITAISIMLIPFLFLGGFFMILGEIVFYAPFFFLALWKRYCQHFFANSFLYIKA